MDKDELYQDVVSRVREATKHVIGVPKDDVDRDALVDLIANALTKALPERVLAKTKIVYDGKMIHFSIPLII